MRMQKSVLFGVALLLFAGCSGGDEGTNPKTYPVTGTVTMGGSPVAGATVSFQLADGSRSAVGITDDGGKYKLTTFAADDGAVPGDYKISLFKLEGDKVAAAPAGQLASGELSEDYDPNVKPATAAPKHLLPAKFANGATSGLTAKVAESGENKFDFDLK
jgi:hypothetical protein